MKDFHEPAPEAGRCVAGTRPWTASSSLRRRAGSRTGTRRCWRWSRSRRRPSPTPARTATSGTPGPTLEALVETSPIGVVVFDAVTGAPQSFNREAKRILAGLHTPGRALLSYRQEQAVDMGTGAVVAVTMHGGDTTSLPVTVEEVERGLDRLGLEVREVVADKKYRSNATMVGVKKGGGAAT